MLDLSSLLEHWGYAGIFVAVALGNVGLPVPEETILALAGYAAWRGQLSLPKVIAVGVISAVIGDNIGYWLGRRYGRKALERFGRWVFVTPERLQKISDFMTRYGALAVFAARFVAGLRFLAGPVAGSTGVSPLTFVVANFLGALLYVPYAVGLGYALGYGFGDVLQRLEGRVAEVVVSAAIILTLAFVVVRILRSRRAARRS